MSVVEEIKARISIVDIVSESGVKLRKSGKAYIGFCPFHKNTRTPAFAVWPESGTWRCFGQCNEGGDIFKFLMKKENIDFSEALHRLAMRAGVKLEESASPQDQIRREAHEHLRALLEEAVIFYHAQLQQHPLAQSYLQEKRRLRPETIEAFGLGYAPPNWNSALQYFLGRGYQEEDLIAAGLVNLREEEGHTRLFDRFRNRIMIPIRDEQGRMAGFGARALSAEDQPKFLNSPETPLFSKGRLLYGLDRARRAIRAADHVVIVEGYFDVIALHQAGFENVVSPMGTALTEDQMRLLKRFTRRIVLALDPDVAGQKAVLRGLEAARQAMDREAEITFEPRRMMHFESRLQADLRVVTLPEGHDPDELVAEDASRWPHLIAQARPVVLYVMETLAEGRNLDDPKVKSEIAGQVLPLIQEVADPVERDAYRQALARLLRVDERVFIGSGARGPARARRGKMPELAARGEKGTPAPIMVPPASPAMESYCLAVLLQHPHLLYRLDRLLQEQGLTPLNAEDFEYTDHRQIFELLRKAIRQDAMEHRSYLWKHIPDTLEERLQELENITIQEKLEERLVEELVRNVIHLRRRLFREHLGQLRYLQEEAEREADENLSTYRQMVREYGELLRNLDMAYRHLSMVRG
uniref:DNA primase n=1 Tax=uncultured Chloroflexota bacterium TaxID=166587 RepID=H5SL31_9CHLR|nr:DNA primase [uncultured Chloroflexota bacterium]BAL56867.1 DNA primase [uncultured Chloroflexota bacterium]